MDRILQHGKVKFCTLATFVDRQDTKLVLSHGCDKSVCKSSYSFLMAA